MFENTDSSTSPTHPFHSAHQFCACCSSMAFPGWLRMAQEVPNTNWYRQIFLGNVSLCMSLHQNWRRLCVSAFKWLSRRRCWGRIACCDRGLRLWRAEAEQQKALVVSASSRWHCLLSPGECFKRHLLKYAAKFAQHMCRLICKYGAHPFCHLSFV